MYLTCTRAHPAYHADFVGRDRDSCTEVSDVNARRRVRWTAASSTRDGCQKRSDTIGRVRLVVVAALVAGCYDPDPPLGIPCSDTGDCPTGQECDQATLVCMLPTELRTWREDTAEDLAGGTTRDAIVESSGFVGPVAYAHGRVRLTGVDGDRIAERSGRRHVGRCLGRCRRGRLLERHRSRFRNARARWSRRDRGRQRDGACRRRGRARQRRRSGGSS